MRLQSVLLVLLAVALVAGCRKAATSSQVAPAPPVQASGPPPTEAEARQFAADLEAAVKAGDWPP